MTTTIFTIGHSTLSWDAFEATLRAHNIDTLVDVRTIPQSKHNPQFGHETLLKSLLRAKINHTFFGRELGGRHNDPALYREGVLDYERVAETRTFTEGITNLRRLAEGRRVALMCSERDALTCHRGLLISPTLVALGHPVVHIQTPTQTLTHYDVECLLMEQFGLLGDDLFRARADIVKEAFRRQAARIAPRRRFDTPASTRVV